MIAVNVKNSTTYSLDSIEPHTLYIQYTVGISDKSISIASARETVVPAILIDNNTHKDLELCKELVW